MDEMEDGIWRVTAPNPSPFTYRGTNSYLVTRGADVTVIDPGPLDNGHLEALIDGLSGRSLSRIIVTHAHRDHSPLARPLSEATGAEIWAFGSATSGQSAVMSGLAQAGLTGGGEGVDEEFEPDRTLEDGATIGPFEVIHTPGHMGGHICLSLGDVVFSGDHVMGWATSLVSPPDGDLTDFMASCHKLAMRPARVFYPGHGDPVSDPKDRLEWLIAHRLERESQIRRVLRAGDKGDTGLTVSEITATVYTDVAPHLLPAAERNVFAHLVDLTGRDLARAEPRLGISSRFVATPTT